MAASEYGHIDIVKYLIEKGADVNAKEKYGSTVFIYSGDNLELIKYFIEVKGFDINSKNKYSMTALMNASYSYRDNVEVVKYLIENGADINAKNKNGYTALDIAVENKFTEIIFILKGTGAIDSSEIK